MKNPLLTLCMIVKDEEKNLAPCLQNVRDIADQIVVVDTGSSDATRNIAQQFTPHVYDYTWNNDFSSARNFALTHADGEWILHLDADERIDSASWSSLRSLLSDSMADALLVNVRNFHPSSDSVQFLDSRQVRLFRNHPAYRYENRIHEQISSSILRQKGRLEPTNLLILHYGYQKDAERKAQRNLQLIEQELRANADDPYLLFKKGESHKALNQFDKAEQSFRKILENPQTGLEGDLLATLYLRLAQIVLQRNAFSSALNYSEQSIAIDPKNIAAHYVRAVASLYTHQLDEAKQSLLAIEQWDDNHILKQKDIHQLHVVLDHLKDKREAVRA